MLVSCVFELTRAATAIDLQSYTKCVWTTRKPHQATQVTCFVTAHAATDNEIYDTPYIVYSYIRPDVSVQSQTVQSSPYSHSPSIRRVAQPLNHSPHCVALVVFHSHSSSPSSTPPIVSMEINCHLCRSCLSLGDASWDWQLGIGGGPPQRGEFAGTGAGDRPSSVPVS